MRKRIFILSGCIAFLLGACTPDYSLPPPHNPKGVPGPGSPALHSEAVGELDAIKHTEYAHEITIDEEQGIFDYDCSGFVDYALSNTAPDALDTLRAAGETKRPQARTYIELISGIRAHMTRDRWTAVSRVADLLPGDVVAWLAIVLVTENDAPVAYRWNESSHTKVTRTRIVLGRVL